MNAANIPMTHENGSIVERVPSQRTQVLSAVTDPTPMVTNTPQTESHAVSNTNDDKWLNRSDVPEKILEHIEKRASLTKSWFKPGRIARAIGETPQAVGPAIAAMYRSDDYRQIAERRQAGESYVYRVEVDR